MRLGLPACTKGGGGGGLSPTKVCFWDDSGACFMGVIVRLGPVRAAGGGFTCGCLTPGCPLLLEDVLGEYIVVPLRVAYSKRRHLSYIWLVVMRSTL